MILHTNMIRVSVIIAALTIGAVQAQTTSADDAKTPTPATTPSAPATFGSFSILGTTATGKTLFLKLPPNQTLEAAITQTADELGKALDAKPALSGAFADAKSKSKGGASLTGKLQGADIKGILFCSIGPNGGSATVIIDAPDASKDDIATLFGFMPQELKMTTHTFPDGSGSIDLPEGWTTPTTSASNGVVAFGPAGQTVAYCIVVPVYDPNCMGQRMAKQTYQMQMQTYKMQMNNYQNMVQTHQRFPNTLAPGAPPQEPVAPDPDPNMESIKKHLPMRYCKYCDGPDEVMKVWYPLSEQWGKAAGGPYTSVDKVIFVNPADPDPTHPTVKSGTVYLAVTDRDKDKETRVRVLNYISTTNVVVGEVWQLNMSLMRAPDATFDKDLPVMKAIMNSIKLDMHVVTGEIAAQGEATRALGRQMFAAQQERHQEWRDQQARQFQDHEMQIAAQEQARHDSASDFIEYIGGVRDVYDNQTGQMHSVDLFHSDSIVEGMNTAANDPGRFVQIPLRYER